MTLIRAYLKVLYSRANNLYITWWVSLFFYGMILISTLLNGSAVGQRIAGSLYLFATGMIFYNYWRKEQYKSKLLADYYERRSAAKKRKRVQKEGIN